MPDDVRAQRDERSKEASIENKLHVDNAINLFNGQISVRSVAMVCGTILCLVAFWFSAATSVPNSIPNAHTLSGLSRISDMAMANKNLALNFSVVLEEDRWTVTQRRGQLGDHRPFIDMTIKIRESSNEVLSHIFEMETDWYAFNREIRVLQIIYREELGLNWATLQSWFWSLYPKRFLPTVQGTTVPSGSDGNTMTTGNKIKPSSSAFLPSSTQLTSVDRQSRMVCDVLFKSHEHLTLLNTTLSEVDRSFSLVVASNSRLFSHFKNRLFEKRSTWGGLKQEGLLFFEMDTSFKKWVKEIVLLLTDTNDDFDEAVRIISTYKRLIKRAMNELILKKSIWGCAVQAEGWDENGGAVKLDAKTTISQIVEMSLNWHAEKTHVAT